MTGAEFDCSASGPTLCNLHDIPEILFRFLNLKICTVLLLLHCAAAAATLLYCSLLCYKFCNARNVWIKEGDGTDKTDAAAVKKGAEVKKMGLIFRSLNLVAHCHLLLRTAHRKLSRNPPGTDITKKLKFAATLLLIQYLPTGRRQLSWNPKKDSESQSIFSLEQCTWILLEKKSFAPETKERTISS